MSHSTSVRLITTDETVVFWSFWKVEKLVQDGFARWLGRSQNRARMVHVRAMDFRPMASFDPEHGAPAPRTWQLVPSGRGLGPLQRRSG